MTRSLRLFAGVVLVLAMSACGAQATKDVAPFEEIAVFGPDIETDPSGTAAILTVESSIDAVCAVSYGEDGLVGSIATDREMDPEGHSDHRVVLSGLQPDTEYVYRLQGVGFGRSDLSKRRLQVSHSRSCGVGAGPESGGRWVGGRGELGVPPTASGQFSRSMATSVPNGRVVVTETMRSSRWIWGRKPTSPRWLSARGR